MAHEVQCKLFGLSTSLPCDNVHKTKTYFLRLEQHIFSKFYVVQNLKKIFHDKFSVHCCLCRSSAKERKAQEICNPAIVEIMMPCKLPIVVYLLLELYKEKIIYP